jgi:hypothetical protein
MTKLTLLALTILAFAAFSSCQTKSKHDHGDNSEIVLNDGKKWVVVPEMFTIIKAMESDINSFNGTTIEDHKNLGTKLQDNINKLTSNCTMKGQGHDELHKWLLPFLDYVAAYNEVNTVAEATSIYNKMKASYDSVNIFFE